MTAKTASPKIAPKAEARVEAPESRKVNKPDPSKVKSGDLMAFVYYAKVQSVLSHGSDLNVRNVDNDTPFGVHGRELVLASFSADQYAEEVKVTKTEAAEILISAFNKPFTVVFTKQDGSERKLRGRLVAPEPLLGRSHVEDLDIDVKLKGSRLRLVDHRTIISLTVDGVKYVVK